MPCAPFRVNSATPRDVATVAEEVLCAECWARGKEVRMRWDADFGGHLCPECEPLDVKMIGRPEERLERYERVYPDPTKEAEGGGDRG